MYGQSHILWDLRDFQLESCDATYRVWDRGITSAINVVPTGCGKTVIAAEMHARHDGSPSLFLVPRDELMDQSDKKFKSMIPGKKIETLARLGSIGREAKGYRLKQIKSADIVIAMVPSLVNVLDEFPRHHFGMIGTDECHHGPARTYSQIYRHFAPGALRQYGLTATPDRCDGVGMFNVYSEVAFEMSIIKAVSEGWLVWPEQENVPLSEFDLRSTAISPSGEIHGGQLTKLLIRPNLLEKIVGRTIRIADGRKLAFYCHRKQVSRAVHEILNKRGIKNYYIDESTPKGFRKNAIQEFSSPGGCKVLSSVNALAEGFDCPLLEVIGFLCPTASIGTFKQKFGRLTRPFLPPKAMTAEARLAELKSQGKRAVFLDFVGASGKHKLCSAADVLGESLIDEERRTIKRIADMAGGPVDMRAVIAQAKAEVAEIRRNRVIQPTGNPAQDHQILQAYKPHPFDVLRIDRSLSSAVSSFTAADLHEAKSILMEYELRFDEIGRLIDTEKVLLSRIIIARRQERLASFRQASLLHKCGYDPRQIRSGDASRLITRIRECGWARPPEDGENELLKKLKGVA
jgi:superfamily II DNA or RNA helicase